MSPSQTQRLLQEAVVHHRAGRLAQADALYRRVRALQPRDFDACHLSGIIALHQGRAGEATSLLSIAHQVNPRNVPCAHRLGHALIAQGRPADAEPIFRAALAVDGKVAESWDHLAYCLKLQDKLVEALDCHQKAVNLKKDFALGWYNFGLTLSLAGRYSDALRCHDHAIAANATYTKGYYGRAQALHQLHRLPEAVAAYDKFLELEPAMHEARSYRLFALNHLDQLDRAALFAEHVNYGKAVGEIAPPVFPHLAEPERRLRVAILSPDLRAHSCAYFLEPLLRHLDSQEFELYLYHDHFREDAVSERLRSLAAVWRNFVGQPVPAIEATIREDRPDILIDLAGHTGMSCRLPLFAKHLAPVQINYLGYPNTTGLRAMHYRFTDAVVDPVGEADSFATEKLVRFAPTAWAYDPPATAPDIVPRAENQPITFGCFNNIAKISDATISLWAKVMASVPDSRLLLKGRGFGDGAMRQRYLDRFSSLGLPVDRVEFLERTTKTEDHLALYHRVDISLDTFPYHGTTTTCEALWMGVPVITMMGDRHVARVSGSILKAVGHAEWVAETPDDYVRIATELAADRSRLATARASLREKVRRSPLGQHQDQSTRFAEALRECWRNWCAASPSHRDTSVSSKQVASMP